MIKKAAEKKWKMKNGRKIKIKQQKNKKNGRKIKNMA